MAWVEKHRNSYLVRERVNGKKKTLRTFSTHEQGVSHLLNNVLRNYS